MMKGTMKSLVLVALVLLAGCTTIKMDLPKTLPEPERKPLSTQQQAIESADAKPAQQLQIESLPALNVASWKGVDDRWKKFEMPQGKLSLQADAIPLNEFIHMALGETLKLSFTVDKDVAARTEPVTLHVSQPVDAQRLLGMIEQALAVYDIGLTQDAGGLRVLPAAALRATAPKLLSPKAALSLLNGRVMLLIPLTYIGPSEALAFAQAFLQGNKGSFMSPIPHLNALLLIGMSERVAKFKQAIEMIDRPSMESKQVTLIRPVYWKVKSLLKPLEEGLAAQGVKVAHSAGAYGMRLIALDEINALMAISPVKAWGSLLNNWVKRLDTPETVDALDEGEQAFVYFVRQSQAKNLGATLNAVLGGVQQQVGSAKGDKTKQSKSAVQPASAQTPNIGGAGKLRVVVDEQHNALVFVGSARSYRVAYQLLKQLDRPVKQVLIEATVADISLDASTQLGVEWQFAGVGRGNGLTGTLSTLGGLGVGAAGLSYSLVNAAGAVRAKLNALASEGKAKILSSPRLLARDNEEARIQVGTQVAVLSQEVASAAGTTGTTTGLLRSFTYVDTGVILSFTPTVMESGAVQLKITQEVSEAGTSTNNTPPISTRNVSTVLVAQSGQTIMIGGLITHNKGITRTKVPFLGDIPILGQLFSNTTVTDRSTEMIILITPHVIESAQDADFYTQSFQQQLHWDAYDGTVLPQ